MTNSYGWQQGVYPQERQPTGLYPHKQLTDENTDENPGDDPSWESAAYLHMSSNWAPIDCISSGTQYFRANAKIYLPQEPQELEDAWHRRVNHATFSPYVMRIAEQAVGLILRKDISLESNSEDSDIDPYWEEFRDDCDGHGTSIDSFARRVCLSSILYGHAGLLVDFPSREAAPSLQAERLSGLRPYFVGPIDAKAIIGWRRDSNDPLSPVTQVRINEYVSVPLGEFGESIERQIRVLEPGKYRIYRREHSNRQSSSGQGQWYIYDQGTISLDIIPLSMAYSEKLDEYTSVPPLLAIANLNISHAQRNADLQHALHVAAMPIMVLKGFDEASDPVGLSVNNAILLPPEGDAMMIEPASQSFQAQQDYLTKLEEQMSSLGISTLFQQKMAGETAESKKISRSDSDALISIISKDLERCLQNAINIAAEFASKEPPIVKLDRDFDLQVLEGDQIDKYQALWMNGAITQETLLSALKRGEVLPDIDVDEEVELTSQEKLDNMAVMMAESEVGPQADEEGNEQREPQVRDDMLSRIQNATAPRDVE